jgi:hypothetical protein
MPPQQAKYAAYRVPPAAQAAIYPGMSLVNNVRVVFTHVFGATGLPLPGRPDVVFGPGSHLRAAGDRSRGPFLEPAPVLTEGGNERRRAAGPSEARSAGS